MIQSLNPAVPVADTAIASIPGEFESHMLDIAQWFLENPPKDAGT